MVFTSTRCGHLGVAELVDVVQPAPLVLGAPIKESEEGLLDSLGERAAPAGAHRDAIDRTDRGDFNGGPRGEKPARGAQGPRGHTAVPPFHTELAAPAKCGAAGGA